MSTVDDHARDDGGTQMVDLAHYRAKRMRHRLLLVVERLLRGIEQRDVERVWALLDEPEAYRCIPSNVRQEALMLAQLPRTSLRAPMRLYRFQYLLRRLGDEPLDQPFDPSQLALELTPAPMTKRPISVRELAFRERRSPNGGPRRRGRNRRRTGSR
ncbi:MAG: hypothetical protein ACJ79A_14730 [Gemmatimonadaceae bacterium]